MASLNLTTTTDASSGADRIGQALVTISQGRMQSRVITPNVSSNLAVSSQEQDSDISKKIAAIACGAMLGAGTGAVVGWIAGPPGQQLA